MSSCMSPMPDAFESSGVCAGHGVCVNSVRDPTLLLCKCDQGYSGASDFFDNRVEKLLDGSWLSYSCDQSDIGRYVMWSLFTLVGLIRIYQLFPIWLQYYHKHYADPNKVLGGVWKDAPLRILSFDLFGITLCYSFVAGPSKLAGLTFGTDVFPTVFFCLGTLIFQFVFFDLTRTEMNIFVQGTTNPTEAEKAKRMRLVFKFIGLTFSFVFTIVPTLWSLSTDKTLGPFVEGNFEEFAIYSRNIGSIAYGLGELFSTFMIRRRVRKILAIVGDSDDAVAYIIKRMNEEMKSYIIYACTIGVTYAIFCIPPLLSHQGYLISFIVGVGGLRHSGKSFIQDKELKAKGVPTESGGMVKLTNRVSNPSVSSKDKDSSEKRASILSASKRTAKSTSPASSEPNSLVQKEPISFIQQEKALVSQEIVLEMDVGINLGENQAGA